MGPAPATRQTSLRNLKFDMPSHSQPHILLRLISLMPSYTRYVSPRRCIIAFRPRCTSLPSIPFRSAAPMGRLSQAREDFHRIGAYRYGIQFYLVVGIYRCCMIQDMQPWHRSIDKSIQYPRRNSPIRGLPSFHTCIRKKGLLL